MNRKVEKYIKSVFTSNSEVIDNPTCYIYDLEEITNRIKEIDKYKLKNVSLYYAMKANPNKQVIQHILSHDGSKRICSEVSSYMFHKHFKWHLICAWVRRQ